jgi:hypothetical protein
MDDGEANWPRPLNFGDIVVRFPLPICIVARMRVAVTYRYGFGDP